MQEELRQGIGEALGRIPSGLFVLTARHEDRRAGMLAAWVQQCCFEPPMVSVAVAKGRPIMPLLSESRQFALCQIPSDERLLSRKFSKMTDLAEDPFLGCELVADTVTDLPVPRSCLAYLECEVSCHMDVDGDHDLFVGLVVGGRYLNGTPAVRIRENGFEY